jgi:hypothetical protein
MVEISDALPGADLIREGFRDLEAGVESVPALLVLIGAPRLRRLGFDVADTPYFPEDRLYEKLASSYGDGAHSQYNALIRLLVSFERAAEHQATRERSALPLQ